MTDESPEDDRACGEDMPMVIQKLDHWLDSLTPDAMHAVLKTLWDRRLKEEPPERPEKSRPPNLYIVQNHSPD